MIFSLGCATPDKPVPDAEAFTAPESIQPIIEKGVAWVKKAAEQGSANAQYEMGTYYTTEELGMKDLQQAYFWFSLAKEKNEKAKNALSHVSIEIKPDELLRAIEMVTEFKEKNK